MNKILSAAFAAVALMGLTAGANAAPINGGQDLKSAIERDATRAEKTHGWHRTCMRGRWGWHRHRYHGRVGCVPRWHKRRWHRHY